MKRLLIAWLICLLSTQGLAQSVDKAPGSRGLSRTYFKFTCIPDLDYFKFETIETWGWQQEDWSTFKTEEDLYAYFDKKFESLWNEHGIFYETNGEVKEYTCNTQNKITINYKTEITHYSYPIGIFSVKIGDDLIFPKMYFAERTNTVKYFIYQEGRILIYEHDWGEGNLGYDMYTVLYYDTPECVRDLKKIIHGYPILSDPDAGTEKPLFVQEPCYAYQRTRPLPDPQSIKDVGSEK